MKPKVICHLLYRLDYGGLENGVVNLINGLPSKKYLHKIISLKSATEFKKRITAKNVEIYELGKRDGKDLSSYVKAWKLLRTLRPDIVHTRNLPTVDFLFVAYLSGVRRLVHGEHGLDMAEATKTVWRYTMLRRMVRILPVRYVVVSKDLERWLNFEIRVPRRRISTIYNGVDTDKFRRQAQKVTNSNSQNIDRPHIVIGHVGRLSPVKNQLLLIKAIRWLIQKDPNLRDYLRLHIIGDGPQRSACESLVSHYNLWDVCYMPGVVADIENAYQEFDVFVLPSIREGISNTLLEAMACGIPVVATNVGGTSEVVEHGQTGMLVESHNIEEMGNAIMNYIKNDDVREVHGRNARAVVSSKFSLKRMIREYDELYSQL